MSGSTWSSPEELLPEAHRNPLLYGARAAGVKGCEYEGPALLARRFAETESDWAREEIEKFMTLRACPDCQGARLKPEARAVTVQGLDLPAFTALSVRSAREWMEGLELTDREQYIARQILKEIQARLKFLDDVGLDYLTLDRAAGTLSGGEAQRIRLATQIGSGLVGVLYILDEPSIGLHQRITDAC